MRIGGATEREDQGNEDRARGDCICEERESHVRPREAFRHNP